MGLLDVLNGMQNGPRGPSHPSTQSNGGMSPMTMAILALLAWKAVKHFSGSQPGTQPAPAPAPAPASPGGGLGNVLAGGLGGLLAGGAASGALTGGLGDLMKQLQQGGLGDAANSWVGSGPNKQVSPDDLSRALGADQLDQVASQSGMSRDELLQDLSQYLPQVVDHLTPGGRLPTENELAGRL
ncbi:MAG TPA: YidB family protein [Bradyrhizobium sp.]|nr:YidB family protein [Bradyrhizobium sp.]